MKILGDKIRDAIIEKFSAGSKGKKVEAMERAAKMLKISRSQLYNMLNMAEIPVEFLEDIRSIVGIDVQSLRSELANISEIVEVTSKMKVYTFPIKNQREAKVVLPNDADKEDVKTIIKHLNLFETNLS